MIQDYIGQLDILNPELFRFPVTLIGCGGIGSPTAILLAKVGCPNLTVFDPDKVEAHNLPNQFFRKSDLGKYKASAIFDFVKEISDTHTCACSYQFSDREKRPLGMVVSGVDNMHTRLSIWERMRYNTDVPLYVDGRIGGEILEVLTIRPSQVEDVEWYERKFLFSDEDAANLPCTARSIMYTGFVIAGIIVSQIAKWLKGEEYYRRVNLDLKTMTSVLQ